MWQEQAKTLIKEFEGIKLKPYPCPGGYQTIGYGHLIKDTEKFQDGISNSEAELILASDISLANQALTRLVHAPLNPYQRAALVSFIFNVGAGAFQASSLRQKLNRREYQATAEQFPLWVHGGGRILPGLVRRRHNEKALFLRQDQPAQAKLAAIQPSSPVSFWKQAAAFLLSGLTIRN